MVLLLRNWHLVLSDDSNWFTWKFGISPNQQLMNKGYNLCLSAGLKVANIINQRRH